MTRATVSIELGDTEYELGVEVDWYYDGSYEVYQDPFVRFSNDSGREVTTLGVFLLEYARIRDLSMHDAARALDDECADLVLDSYN